MPIILKKQLKSNIEFGLWHLMEDESFFNDRITLSDEEVNQLAKIKGDRRRQWLCARLLLHYLSARENRIECAKDPYGKPFLIGHDYHIGFSHSDAIVAVIAGPMPVGIDIQLSVDKIVRIKDKFTTDEELEELRDLDPQQALHLIWGAKEAAFKAYGRKKVDFKSHLKLYDFQTPNFQMTMKKQGEDHHYSGQFEQWQKYTLVYLWENQ